MNEEKIEKLKELLDQVVYAATKKDARPLLQRLESMSSHLNAEVDQYHRGKLSEAISFAKEASGRVQNKDHWIHCMNSSWYVFKNGVGK